MNAFYFVLAFLFLINIFSLVLNLEYFKTPLRDIIEGDVRSFIQNMFKPETILAAAGVLVLTYFIGGNVVRNITGIAIVFTIIFTTNIFFKPTIPDPTINLFFTLFFNFMLLVAMLTFLIYK